MGVKCRWPSVAIPVSPVTPGNGRHGGIDDARRTIRRRFHESGHAADVGALEPGLNPSPPTTARTSPQAAVSPATGEGTRSRPGSARAPAAGLSPPGYTVSPGQTAQDAQRRRQARYGIETILSSST